MNEEQIIEALGKVFRNANIDQINVRTEEEYLAIKSRIMTKYIDLYKEHGNGMLDFIVSDTDSIDEDMFKLGTIIGNRYLHLVVEPMKLTIDLRNAIENAFFYRKLGLIHLMLRLEINLELIEPNVMIMCVERDEDELLKKFIDKGYNIAIESYRVLYTVAALGKLDLVKYIMAKCRFHSVSEIIYKVCIQAVYNNHVQILEYFFTDDVFKGAPDKMLDFFVGSITNGSGVDISIIEFFATRLNIKQDNYRCVRAAIQANRAQIVQYFVDTNPEVYNILTVDERIKFGVIKLDTENKYIGLDKTCLISLDKIGENDMYVECENSLHQFMQNSWMKWNRINSNWLCPVCFSPVKKISYINKMLCD